MTAIAESLNAISFQVKLITINRWLIARVPEKESLRLPSRGQVMTQVMLNGTSFETPLEPDGKWSHWFSINTSLQQKLGIQAGDTVAITITPIKSWPEPEVSKDLMDAIKTDDAVYNLWKQITPMARWEWVRWTRSTNKDETRKRRVEVAVSKMKKGERRPCCWNRNLCTEPAVSKGGVLLDATSL